MAKREERLDVVFFLFKKKTAAPPRDKKKNDSGRIESLSVQPLSGKKTGPANGEEVQVYVILKKTETA